MKKILLLSLLSAVSMGLSGQTTDSKWTLRQCVDHALENNIEIKQQALTLEGAEIDLNTSRNSRLPDLGANVSQNFSFGRARFESALGNYVYGSQKTASTSMSLSSNMTLFSGMRINNQIKIDKFNLMAATEGFKKAKENLELQVTSLYLEALFQREVAKVYVEQHGLTQKQVERTDAMVESGKVPKAQLFDIKAQLAKDELSMVTSGNSVELALLNLAQALNIEEYNFDIAEPNATMDGGEVLLPADQVYETALNIKPHVKEAEYRLDGSMKSVAVAKSAYMPTLSLGLSIGSGYYHIFNRSNENFGFQFKNSLQEGIGLTLRVPIFNRLQTRNQVRSARLNVRKQALELDNVKLNIYKDIRQAHQSATAAQSKYQSTQKALEAAQEAYRYAEESYGVGRATVYEFSEAQTKLISSRSEQLQAKYDFIFRSKILDFYRGLEIDIE